MRFFLKVYLPSVIFSILAHVSVILILLISVELKPNNKILNEFLIDLELTENNYNVINKEFSKSKKSIIEKNAKIKNSKIKINKTVDDSKVKEDNYPLKTKSTKKEKIVKFDLKKTKFKPLEYKLLHNFNISEQRMSKFYYNNSISHSNVKLNKNKKYVYKNVRSCLPAKNIKPNNNFKTAQINNNKDITITELLGYNYYNPALININNLLKTPQINKYQTNITDLLSRKKQSKVFCN